MKWAICHKIPFVAQSGGQGWTSSLASVKASGIVINLRAMNSVAVDLEKGEAKISAGALTSDVMNAAFEAKSHVSKLQVSYSPPSVPVAGFV